MMPSGCNLRRFAVQPRNQLAVPEKPSTSAFSEDHSVVDPATMQMNLVTPAFQPRVCEVTILEYRDAQVVFEVDDWFNTLPAAVKRYLLPLQSKYVKWYNETVRDLPQNYAFCELCKQKTANMQRHYLQHHAQWRTIWFCPLPGFPASSANKEGLVRHLQSKQHAKGIDTFRGRMLAKQIVNQNCFWPMNQTFVEKLLRASKRFAMLRSTLWLVWLSRTAYFAFCHVPGT